MEKICKDVFGCILVYLRPLEQRRFAMTCRKFYQWGEYFQPNIPNVPNIDDIFCDWNYWINESTISTTQDMIYRSVYSNGQKSNAIISFHNWYWK